MSTITLRSVKGSALSFTEVDNNFTNLNTDKLEGVTSSVDGELTLWSSTTGKVLKRATITGLVKATAGVATTATAGTDYVAPSGALGTPSSGTLTNCTVDGTNPIGYRDLPAVGTKTTSYTLQTADVGKYVQVGSGGSITIPDATFAEGDVVVIANNHSAAITVTCTITTAYIAGTNTDKASVSLATRGLCTIVFLSGTVCIISGNVS